MRFAPLHGLCSVALSIAVVAADASGDPVRTNRDAGPPAEKQVTYVDTNGVEHVYLVQEPRAQPIPDGTPILLYMHGAGGKEEQGMRTLFPGLRDMLDARGWIYVCPRDTDYAGLRADLSARYGKRRIYLSGASAGGRSAFWEAVREPSHYSGLILMCPAIRADAIVDRVNSDSQVLPIPLWMICGDRDATYAATCRFLKQVKEERHQAVYYREIPGGDHDDPCRQMTWDEALRFVSEHAAKESESDARVGPSATSNSTFRTTSISP